MTGITKLTNEPAGLIILEHHKVIFISDKIEKWLEYSHSEIENKNLWDLVDTDQTQFVKTFTRNFTLSGNRSDFSEVCFVSKSGKKILMEMSIIKTSLKSSKNYTATLRNLGHETHQRLALLSRSKMDAIAELSGGIAHEFNNILMSIMGYLSLAKMRLEDSDPVVKTLSKAENSCGEGRKLTQELLGYTQTNLYNKKPVSPVILIKKIISGLSIDQQQKIRCTFPDDLWAISIDIESFTRAFLNIFSSFFLTQSDVKIIEISAVNTINRGADMDAIIPGRYVEIVINNRNLESPQVHNSQEIRSFYSTESKALSLKLTTAFFIIRHHRGVMTVGSDLDDRAVCRLLIPAVTESKASKNSRRILVVDDNPAVLNTIRELLDILGYKATGCNSIASAWKEVTGSLKKDTSFELIMIDFLVLGRNPEFIREMQELQPSLKVVIVSSCTNDQIARDPRAHGFEAFLSKPVNLKTMKIILGKIFSTTGG